LDYQATIIIISVKFKNVKRKNNN